MSQHLKKDHYAYWNSKNSRKTGFVTDCYDKIVTKDHHFMLIPLARAFTILCGLNLTMRRIRQKSGLKEFSGSIRAALNLWRQDKLVARAVPDNCFVQSKLQQRELGLGTIQIYRNP